MTRSVIWVAFLFYGIYAYANIQEIEKDVERFKKTNHCNHCDISGVIIREEHEKGTFTHSLAIKTSFKGRLRQMDLTGSVFAYARFCVFCRSQLTIFNEANLTHSRHTMIDYSHASFVNADLSEAEFDTVNFANADFRGANLTGTTFKDAILIGTNLTEAQLKQIKILGCTVMPDGELKYADRCRYLHLQKRKILSSKKWRNGLL